MREIKYRAWYKGKMYKAWLNERTLTSATFEIVQDGMFYVEHLGENSDKAIEFDDTEGEFMQYTGLKDKNGVEIYEGDILRVPAKDKYEEHTYNSFEVFWHDNDATPTDVGLVLGRLTPHGNSAGGVGVGKLIPKTTARLEVIGNIYENPELLDESN